MLTYLLPPFLPLVTFSGFNFKQVLALYIWQIGVHDVLGRVGSGRVWSWIIHILGLGWVKPLVVEGLSQIQKNDPEFTTGGSTF